jgi:aspartyl-tRNA(Asn)/glutamyl-tRNA(Gln) amidotransferase subunit C
MTQFTKETIKTLSQLCRIDCTEEEQEKYLKDMQSIFQYFEQLSEVDTDGVKPINHVLEAIVNVDREDAVGKTMPREEFIELAPSSIGGMIRVPTVIKGM